MADWKDNKNDIYYHTELYLISADDEFYYGNHDCCTIWGMNILMEASPEAEEVEVEESVPAASLKVTL